MSRIGYAVVELGLPFPQVSDDELEQWLVHEALVTSYRRRIELAEQEQRELEATRRQAQELLERARAERGI